MNYSIERARRKRKQVLASRILRRDRYGMVKRQKEYGSRIVGKLYNRRAFERIITEAHKRLSGQGVKGGFKEGILDDLFEELELALNDLLDYAEDLFGEITDRSSKKVMDIRGEPLPVEETTLSHVVRELRSQQNVYFQNVREDQKELVLDKVQSGIEEGKSVTKMRNDITKDVHELTDWQAERIARSETLKANARGMQETMRQNDIEEYVWISAQDARVCPVCQNLHNQIFRIGEGKLPVQDTHPNCRCAIVANTG